MLESSTTSTGVAILLSPPHELVLHYLDLNGCHMQNINKTRKPKEKKTGQSATEPEGLVISYCALDNTIKGWVHGNGSGGVRAWVCGFLGVVGFSGFFVFVVFV